MLSDALVGEGPADPDTVLFRLINGSGTAADAAVVIGKLGTYGSLLLSVAEKSPPGSTAAYEMYDQIKGYLAYELAVLFMADVISAVDQSVSSNNSQTAYADDWRRNEFRNAVSRINADLQLISQQVSMPPETLQTYMTLLDHLVRNYSPLN